MLINRDSKPWLLVCLALFAVATVAYVPYHIASQPKGPSGGTWPGFLYGVAGTAMIVLAMLLTPRKRFRTMRVGRVYWWMQAHVWFGLLSFPVICYHAGIRPGLWGSPLTVALMLLFIGIEVSGILGLVLQNVMPGKLLREVQYETIFEQIDAVSARLRAEATERVAVALAHRVETAFDVETVPSGGRVALAERSAIAAPQRIREFLERRLAPALATGPAPAPPVASDFDRLRAETPLALHDIIDDLQSIADERRQLDRQRRLHTILHAWLWVHVPMSFAMMVLIAVHIFVALRYVRPW